MIIFKEQLKYLRTQYGLSQWELAKELKLNRSSIGSYEEGRAFPRLETLIAIADYFELTVDQLIRKEKRKSIEEFNPLK